MVALPLRRIIVAKPILDWLGRVDRKAKVGGSFDMMMTVVFLLKVAFLGILKRKHSRARVFCCCSVESLIPQAGRRTDGQLL